MKYIALITFLLVCLENAFTQCQVNIEPFDTLGIICGQETFLDVDSVSGTPINNTFDGGFVGSGWSATSAAQFNNPCGWKSSTYLWMGPTSTAPRTLATVPINVSCGGDICFELKYSQQSSASPCEGPDLIGEGVTLQYRTTSTNPWVDINYFQPNSGGSYNAACTGCGDYTAWALYCFPIPFGALGTTTEFRWIQQASSSGGNDHWGLDSITITNNCAHVSHLWSTGDTTLETSSFSLTDSIYWVRRVMNYTDTCYDSIYVEVMEPDPFLTVVPDIAICEGTEVELRVDSIQWLDDTVNYISHWIPSTMVVDASSDTTESLPIYNNTFFYYVVEHPEFPICNSMDSVFVLIGNSMEIDNAVIEKEYCDNQDGKIDLTVSGGTGQYWYAIGSTYNTSKVRNNLKAGVYPITIVDSLTECQLDTFVVVPFEQGISIDNVEHNLISCPGDNDGKATVWSSNNISYMNYQWFKGSSLVTTHPSLWNVDSVKNLYAGEYMVVVSDLKCADTAYFMLDEPDSLKINLDGASNLLCNLVDNVVQPNVSGGTPGYEVNWIDTISPFYSHRGKEDTTLHVFATDSRGCVSETLSIDLLLPDPLRVNLKDTFLCQGTKISLQPEVTGGIGTYTYLWNSGWEQDTLPLTNEVTNTYWVRVGDGCLFPRYDTATVYIHDVPKPYLLHETVCIPSEIVLETNPELTNYTWKIAGDTFYTDGNTLNMHARAGETPVIYSFSTKEGCTVTSYDTLLAYATPVADFYWDENPYYDPKYNNVVAFTSTSNDYESLQWVLPTKRYHGEEMIEHTFTETGKQPVQLIAVNGICSDDTVQWLEIKPSGLIWLPNSFTPNKDLNNDIYKPELNSIVNPKTYAFRIFNRWGELVFKTNDVDEGWDGTYNGELVPAGVYSYDLKVESLTGEELGRQGHITIIY